MYIIKLYVIVMIKLVVFFETFEKRTATIMEDTLEKKKVVANCINI